MRYNWSEQTMSLNVLQAHAGTGSKPDRRSAVSNSTQLPLFDPIVIPLTQGYSTIIDPVDSDLATYRWCVTKGNITAYAKRHMPFSKQAEFIHRIILSRMLGRPLAEDEFTDHIDGNGLNNRRSNLRLATKEQNRQNRSKPANNQSGYKGVSYSKHAKRWLAHIGCDGKTYNLGYYDTPEEARAAYRKAAQKLFGEFTRQEDKE